MTARHNASARLTPLLLSEVPRGGASEVGAGNRLADTARRFEELNPRARRRRYPLELIAREIADNAGNVWPSVHHFGISYEHALRIRNGWRGAGVARAEPIAWRYSRNVGRRSPDWLEELEA